MTTIESLLRTACAALAAGLLGASAAHGQPAPAELESAEFVFVGEVVSTEPPPGLARAKPGTATVRVERVLKPKASPMLAGFQGQTIGVRLRNPEELGKGSVATFYTRIASLGKALDVVEIAHAAAPDVAAKSMQLTQAAAAGERVLDAQRRSDVERGVAQARVVLSGRVVSVQSPAVASAAPSRGRLSEHDPEWREAVVEVDDVLKGEVAAQTVTLRFPSSEDVAWHHAPKLTEGQQGIFLLGPDSVVLSQPEVATPNRAAPAVTKPGNVLPLTEANLKVVSEAAKSTKKQGD